MHFVCVGSSSDRKLTQKTLKNTSKSRQQRFKNGVKMQTPILSSKSDENDLQKWPKRVPKSEKQKNDKFQNN